jgi:hypothetical protein
VSFLQIAVGKTKNAFARFVYYVSEYTICRLVIIIPNHGLNAKLSTHDHSAAVIVVSLAVTIRTRHEIEGKCCQFLHNIGGFFQNKVKQIESTEKFTFIV